MTKAMKDSGILWIGQIPEGWNVKRLKAILAERKEKNDPIKTDFILSLGAQYGVIPYNEKQYEGGNKAKEDLSAYKIAEPGDIVLNSMNVVAGAVGLSKYYGCVSPVYYMFYPRFPQKTNIVYYNMLFQSKVFQRSLLGLGNGILMRESDTGALTSVRMRIPVNKLNVLLLPEPSKDEQTRIAAFLDEKCAAMDNVLEKTKASIEEYKKLKQSVITQAVTKGIRGNRPMKDSGIEWIGQIPEEWEVKRLKRIAKSFSKGNGITKEDVISNGEIQCVRYGEIYSRYNFAFSECVSRTNIALIQPPKYISYGDILFAGTGELIEEIGKNIVYIGQAPCLAGGDIVIMHHSQNHIFLNYALNSYYCQSQKSKGKAKLKVVHISATEIGDILILLPPLDEQQEIASYLDTKCAEIDTLISKKEQFLKEIEAYKKSLIYEYVTGKKEVA